MTIILTTGLISVIQGTASGAQQIGALSAIAVGTYIALAGLWGAPVSGASMNPARSLRPRPGPDDWNAWWAYLAGPIAGGIIAVGIAYVLRGQGGGASGTAAATGTLGTRWRPGRIGGKSGQLTSGQAPRIFAPALPRAHPRRAVSQARMPRANRYTRLRRAVAQFG